VNQILIQIDADTGAQKIAELLKAASNYAGKTVTERQRQMPKKWLELRHW
jgi:hypothetical protein